MDYFHISSNKYGCESNKTSVQDSTETWLDRAHALGYAVQSLHNQNIQKHNRLHKKQVNNLLPISSLAPAPHSLPYQKLISHCAPNLAPYYYTLAIPSPISFNLNLGSEQTAAMDIDKYINYELAKQQMLMRKSVMPRPLDQLQLPANPELMPKKEPRETRIIEVQVVTMAARSRVREPDVEPLPPVEASFKERVTKIGKSQHHYMKLFDRLTSMLQTLNRRYDGNEVEPAPESELEEAPPPPVKRARHDMSSSSSECHLEGEQGGTSLSHYPQLVHLPDGKLEYVLGPNGTRINGKEFGHIFWTSAPVATRCLLAAVFSNDELATHTLTGKPSPAFYGRERPAKKMLDQNRVDDIIVSVRNRTGCKERHIRATITTKCADMAKKYKRRAKKAQKEDVVVIDE